ncbi:MAG: carbon-nitrogen hydrolase family protein [Myxococcota bacterium]
MRIAIAQKNPILLDRRATVELVEASISEAANEGASLVAFGETFVPGYPVWLDRTDAARFDSDVQKDFHAHYVDQAVSIDDLDSIRRLCKSSRVAVVLGIAERDRARGQSIFATAVSIDDTGEIQATHRKLVPTYEERLAWSHGDANGLRTWPLKDFTVGVLNCWENWMPLPRAALHAQGETLHVALWPGSDRTTQDITRFIAREGRSYVVSASALYRAAAVPKSFPHRDLLVTDEGELFQNGASCVAGPDGSWLVEPVVGQEGMFYADVDATQVRRERQNFDPAGHYSRPELLRLSVDRTRFATVFSDDL